MLDYPKGPKIMVFCVTYKCNCRCIMCSIWKKQNVPVQLSIDEISKLFDDKVLNSFLEILCLTGGEPTLRPDLTEITRTALHKCPNLKYIDIPTNGTNTSQVVDQIEKVVALTLPTQANVRASVSLDGVNDIHDRVRRSAGAFGKTTDTIKELRELASLYSQRLSVGASVTITSLNCDTLDAILDYALENGFGISFTPSAISEIFVESIKMRDNFELNNQQRQRVASFYRNLLRRRLIDRFYGQFVINLMMTGKRTVSCPFQRGLAFVLDVNGDIYCCGNFKEFKLGNIRRKSFSEIWAGRRTSNIKKNYHRRCPGCESDCYLYESKPPNPLGKVLSPTGMKDLLLKIIE